MSAPERRDGRRIPCRIGIALCDGQSLGNCQDQLLTYALDVSRTGAFIASVRPLAAGTPVRLDLLVGKGGGVRVEGVVVRTGPSPSPFVLAERGIGVRFTRIDPAVVNYLASMFRK